MQNFKKSCSTLIFLGGIELSEIIELEILGWEKYQFHNGKRSYDWFRVSAFMLDDPQIDQLTPPQFKVWMGLLCRCAKFRQGTIKIDTRSFTVRTRSVQDTITRLEQLQILRVISTTPNRIERRVDRVDRIDRNRLPTGGKTPPPLVAEAPPLPVKTEQDLRKKPEPSNQPDPGTGSVVWEAYREAYNLRYKTDPVRNAMVNASIKQIVARIGIEEAAHVVRFFVTHEDSFYKRKLHAIGLCLQNIEALRTQWATGRAVTDTGVRREAKGDYWKLQRERIERGEV